MNMFMIYSYKYYKNELQYSNLIFIINELIFSITKHFVFLVVFFVLIVVISV